MNTAMLITRCKTKDPDAIRDLVGEYQAGVFRLALSIMDDSAEAEEITQEVFLACIRMLESYRGDSAFTTWLYRITVNISYTRLRKRKSRERIQQALQSIFRLAHSNAPPPEEILVEREADAVVWKAVSALNDKHRLPVILYYYDNLPVSEIAAVLNLPQGTVLSRLHTAREKLRAKLEEYPVNVAPREREQKYEQD